MKSSCSLLVLCWLAAVLPAQTQVSPYYLMTTVAGVGAAPYPGDPQPAKSLPLFEPNRIAFDPTAYLYVSDSHYLRVFQVNVQQSEVYVMAGSGETGKAIDGIDAAERKLYGPRGLAFDANGILYIADGAKIYKVITAMTPGAEPFSIHTVAGTGGGGYSGDGGPATAARMSTPSALAIDSAGNIYLSDDYNCVVRRIAPNGIITTVAGTGEPGYSGDGGNGRLAKLNGPSGLAVASDGTLYIVDTNNHAVRRLRPDGIISTFAGTGVEGFAGDGGSATSARLYNPYGVAVDASGNVLIADTTNRRIRKVTPAGTISTLAQVDCKDIAVSPDGYIAVINHLTQNVRRVYLDSGGTTNLIGNIRSSGVGDGGSATSAVLANPQGVAADASVNLYIADWAENRVRRVNAQGVITTYAGTGEAGDGGDGGQATAATLVQPLAVAADSSGNVYVSCNTKIRRIQSNGVISTFVGTQQAGYNDNPDATKTLINFPYGMTTDAAGNIYIADSGNYRIRRVSTSGILTTFAGTGEEGNTGDGGLATGATLSYLYGVALDNAGNVFISSGLYVRKVSPSGVITTIAGNGEQCHSGDGDLATTLAVDPYTLASDPSGRIYIVDTTNRRIRRLEPAQIFPAGVLNAASYQGSTVAPGEIVTIFGYNIGPASLAKGAFTGGMLSKNVENVQITFDGTPAPLIYVSSGQSSAIVPYSVAGKRTTVMQVANRGTPTNSITLSVADAAPGLFTADASGRGAGAILNQDYSLNTAGNAATRGSVVMIYATGEGQTNPAGVDGKVTGDTLPKPLLPISVTIGGIACEVLYSGAAPGLVTGLMQVNAKVPANAPQGGGIPVRLKVAEKLSRDDVTIAIK